MKFKGAIRMLVVLICACALMQISMSDEAHAGYVKEDILYTPDETLLKYIEEYLPDGNYEMVDSGIATPSYCQMADGKMISYVMGELAKEYGITSTYYIYKNNMSMYQYFLEIKISLDAIITDKDRIYLDFSAFNFMPPDTIAVMYVSEESKVWKQVSSVYVERNPISTSASYQYLSGYSILNNGKERRIFVYIPNVSLSGNDITQNFSVRWEQDILRLAELSISPEKEDNTQIMEWKIILVGLILVFDVAMLVFFLKYIKKPQKEATSQEITTDSEAENVEVIDEEAELMKLSGDRKQEEIDYLKSIGYFKSKPSK